MTYRQLIAVIAAMAFVIPAGRVLIAAEPPQDSEVAPDPQIPDPPIRDPQNEVAETGQGDSTRAVAGGDGELQLPPKTRVEAPSHQPSHWVKQLNSPQFLRRELASRKLVEAGAKGVAAIDDAMRSGDLETIERCVDILTEIALATPPDSDGGAFGSLEATAESAAGVRAELARHAVTEVRDHRAKQAKGALTDAGIFVGNDEFIVRAVSRMRTMIQIDTSWNGEPDSLQWLRWLEEVEFARIKGKAVNQKVIERLVQIPDLRTIALVDAEVDQATLEPLLEMDRIHSLEFRYVRLTPEMCDLIAKMPIRVSLNLMGTGVSTERVEQLRQTLPGLSIEHRQGGFLGVTCYDVDEECMINGVVPGGAAEEAGLIEGDVVVHIAGHRVNRFKDLQNAINQHLPGDEIEVRFRRGMKILSVKLKLRRMKHK